MADKDQIIKEKLDHSGLFNFSSLYNYAHSWYKNEEYGVVEEKYSEKVSGNTKSLLIEWKASKRFSDYFKIEQKIEFEISDMSDVEVEIDGKKSKMNKGKISIEVKGVLVRDPDSAWDAKPFYKFIRDVYNKYIIPGRVDFMEDKVRSDVKDFKEQLKAFLELSGKR